MGWLGKGGMLWLALATAPVCDSVWVHKSIRSINLHIGIRGVIVGSAVCLS